MIAGLQGKHSTHGLIQVCLDARQYLLLASEIVLLCLKFLLFIIVRSH